MIDTIKTREKEIAQFKEFPQVKLETPKLFSKIKITFLKRKIFEFFISIKK